MDISIIVPAYGKPDILIRCLSSLGNQTTEASCEICVVDDGSGLDKDTICQSATCPYPIIWHSFETNRGRSVARNTGIDNTTGTVVIFLDADMEVSEGFLDAHLEMHRTHPNTAGIGAITWPSGGSFYRYIGSRGIVKLNADASVPPWYFVTGNASIERQQLPPQPVFDETLKGWGGEDLDLGMRLAEAGVQFKSIPDALSFHHFSGTLSGHITRTTAYGYHALPILIDRYPKLREVTRIDRLDSSLMRFLVSTTVHGPIRMAASFFDILPLPALLFDYLTFAAYARGYMEHER